MTVLYFVRHAKPAATWGESTDSGLDETGREQAERTAEVLNDRLPQLRIYTSPLRRCVETAHPLAKRWAADAQVLKEVAEIPAPAMPMSQRREWLSSGMQGTWQDLQRNSPAGSPDYLEWRSHLLQVLHRMTEDAVIFSHYIAINVVAGAAQGSDRVITFSPGHASVTEVEVSGGQLKIRKLGEESTAGGILLGK